MTLFYAFTLAFAPGLFWLWHFYRKDKLDPEPKSLIAKTFIYGILIAVPVSLFEAPFSANKFVLFVVAAPVIEEYAKYFVVRRSAFRSPHFNEPMDGIVYAAAASLGFASIETVSYLFLYSQRGMMIKVFVLRGLLSIPGHVLFSSTWGYALGFAKGMEKKAGKKIIRSGLLLGMCLHGLFNFLLGIPLAALGLLIAVPLMWRMTNQRIKKAIEASPFAKVIKKDVNGM